MKVIIAGTRTFDDYDFLKEMVESTKIEITEVVCGEAPGADTLGRIYANNNNLPIKSFPAKWDVYGKKAGYIRNEEMACYGDILLAFWDKKSRGTAMMIQLMRRKNKPIYIFSI